MNDNLIKYRDAFFEAFELEEDYELKDLKYQSIDEWDSIGHMTLISGLEESFSTNVK